MCGTLCVLWLARCVVLAYSWEFAVSHGDRLDFYTNDTKINTVRFDSHNIGALAYDEVHNMILYVDKHSDGDIICGYDISSIENECFIEGNGRNIHGIAFDPATELLFFSDTKERSINWVSLKSGSNRNGYGNLLIKLDHGTPTDVAVDSCRGYFYWINTDLSTPTIERARFNGSERQVIIDSISVSINTTYQLEPHSLNIDEKTQKMYWVEPINSTVYKIYFADLNGQYKTYISRVVFTTFSGRFFNPATNKMTVSKTKLIRSDWCFECNVKVAKLGKINWEGVRNVEFDTKSEVTGLAANYKIKEKIQDTQACEALTNFEQKKCDVPSCVHGVKVIEQSVCKCTPGYIGGQCDVSVCDNNYCLQGNCTVNDDGLPLCRCYPGYSGERCEVNLCNGYCLNNGVCYLDEADEPSCECVRGYQGTKCEVVQTATLTLTNTPSDTNPTLTDLLSNVRNNISTICFIVDKS